MAYPTAEEFLPLGMNLTSLRRAAVDCQGCDLYTNATKTVFGEGARRATIMFVGEIPGDEEDKTGHPFVGPAGRLLDAALDEAGIERDAVYLTNAVKHFRWELRGKRRLHKKPNRGQVEACKPWLHAEILVVKPQVIVCLGATAAQSLLGHQFRIMRQRGKFFDPTPGTNGAASVMATHHPSSILRAPDKVERDRKREELVDDLRRAMSRVGGADKKRGRLASR
jgi:DNA polymerase